PLNAPISYAVVATFVNSKQKRTSLENLSHRDIYPEFEFDVLIINSLHKQKSSILTTDKHG
ncbi:MAG: hypothetical protein P8Y12_04290, partial [Gammaproteobacteria bacterium]